MIKIYISPSVQVSNIYSDGRTNERDACFLIGERVESLLKKYQINVKMSKRTYGLASAVAESNIFGADYHLCIHTNAGGGEGTRLFVYPDNLNLPVAKALLKCVGEISIGKVDKIVANTTFYEIMKTKAKCLYLEVEFHDTHGDWIVANFDRIAEGIVNGLVEGLNLETNPQIEDCEDFESKKTLYRVQCGAFTTLTNARQFQSDLKRLHNIDAYIVEY